MSRGLFVITDQAPDGFALGLEEMGFEVKVNEKLTQDQVNALAPQLTGIVTYSALKHDAKWLARAKNLKYILRPGSGLDGIDLDAAKAHGVFVFSSPEANAPAVGEMALALLLDLIRKTHSAHQGVIKGNWPRLASTGTALDGLQVGVWGYGQTGKNFVKRLRGFDCKVGVYDKYVHFLPDRDHVSAQTETAMFASSEVISLHIPLTDETRGMVNEEWLSQFQKPIYLINTARGGIVDLEALLVSIERGQVLGAGLDVLPNEKLETYSAEEKELLKRLIDTGKVTFTPHIAGWTQTARAHIFWKVLDKLKTHLQANEG